MSAAGQSEFVAFLAEVFENFGRIEARRMFGGYGLYHEDVMFGLVADDVLYLKADAESATAFVERGLAPFEYVKQGRPTRLSYYMAPETVFDDRDEATAWARLAFEAALRSRRK